jgi:amidase
VRGPAACCGVIGMKPTFGRVSRRGVAPARTTLDCVGPFAREMLTLIKAMAAIAPGFDDTLANTVPRDVRIGVISVDSNRAIGDAVANAPALAGFASQTLELLNLSAAFDAGLTVINAETWAAVGHLIETGKVGADLDARLRHAATTTKADLAVAESVRAGFTAEVDHALQSVDVLALPTLPDFPITLEAARRGTSVIAMSSLIRPFNLSGHPALSLPITVEGSPLKAGLQIVGRKGDDERVCAIAACFEAAML